nr:glutenin, high molecular weight subunit 12-like [Leptinotarsa decemlineata]
MKCVLLFCFIAFCYAVPTVPTLPNVQFGEDGTITITGADGKKVVISKSAGSDGQKNVEITLPDPLGTTKSIKINQDYNQKTVNIEDSSGGRYKRSSVSKTSKETKKGKSEAEILDEIFKDYQGAVDLKSYEKVLKEIDSYVKSGDLDSSIYEVLKGFAQYDALNPEGYPGQNKIGYTSALGYSPRLVSLQNYLNKVIGEQQSLNGGWYGKQPVLGSSQGPIWYKDAQAQFYGPNGENLQQYRQSYEPLQNLPQQAGQQFVQQSLLPLSGPYQQQFPQQQLYQPQQPLGVPQSQWNSLPLIPKQQSAQNQDFLWGQQLSFPQQQKIQSQQVLPQIQRQPNVLEQFPQQLSWSQAGQQYYGPQQQYYGPHHQSELQVSQGEQQQQYIQPQQQYELYQQQSYLPGGQVPQPKQNVIYPPQLQHNLNEPVWAVPKQQVRPELQGLYQSQGQQTPSDWYYRLKPQAAQLGRLQYPANLQVV